MEQLKPFELAYLVSLRALGWNVGFRFVDQPPHGHHDGIAMDQCQDCWDKYYGIDRSTITLAHLLNQGEE